MYVCTYGVGIIGAGLWAGYCHPKPGRVLEILPRPYTENVEENPACSGRAGTIAKPIYR